MEEKVFEITKSKILEMARKCPTARSILEVGFPEAFEPDFEYFKGGAIFHMDRASILTIPGNYMKSEYFNNTAPTFMLDKSTDMPYNISGSNVTNLLVLIHDKNSHEYRLIHLGTGYRFNGKVYLRKSKGIAIPKEDLNGLHLFYEGGGK